MDTFLQNYWWLALGGHVALLVGVGVVQYRRYKQRKAIIAKVRKNKRIVILN